MKQLRRTLLLAFVAAVAMTMMNVQPASASEVCVAGKVLGQSLPGCNNCPPGVSVGPSGVNPFVSVFVCANP